MLTEALAIEEATLDSEHPDVALTLTFLANCLCRQAKPHKAEAAARRALAISVVRLGRVTHRQRRVKGRLAVASTGLRRFAK